MRNYLLLLALLMVGCETRDNYMRNHGNPIYKVSLLNNSGGIVETKFAHEKHESWDWGMNRNFQFRYYSWSWYKDSKKYGFSHLQEWEWPKTNVRIEPATQ